MKSKTGEALRKAKKAHEASVRKEKEALRRKNRFEGLSREADHELQYLKKAHKVDDRPSTLAKQKALQKEAMALKRENKAKLELEKATTPEEKHVA